MTFKKSLSLIITAMIIFIAFSSFGVLAAEAVDLTVTPKTEAEMENAVLNGYKEAIKLRKNETQSGRWAQTAYTVKIDFSQFTEAKYKVQNSAIVDPSYIFTLDIFTALGNMSELDYEFLVLKGGDGGEYNTFSISFSVSMNRQNEIMSMNVTYTLTWGENKAESLLVKQHCRQVVAELITSGMSDYQKVKTLHDYIASNFSYATDELANGVENIYYPIYMIENGKGVCQAYTGLFNCLMEEAGLGDKEIAVRHDSFANNGSGSGYIGHAWNMVKLGNAWYHIDTTWDDPGRSTRYDYFLKSDNTFSKDHRWKSNFYPAAPKDYSEQQSTSSVIPSQPASSTVPSQPASSTVPSQPASSTVPSQPASSTVPSQPASSTVPSQPESSTVPSQPASSTVPSQPASSTVPSQPASSIVPSEPESSDPDESSSDVLTSVPDEGGFAPIPASVIETAVLVALPAAAIVFIVILFVFIKKKK